MTLIDDWKLILKKAWSARLMIIAAVLSGIEIILPFFSNEIPRSIFAAGSFVAVSGAFIARFISQKALNGDQ